MSRFFSVSVVVCALLFLANGSFAATPSPDDYAYGRTLTLPAGSAIGECELPLTVYARVTSANLADLAVFNGRAEAVPFQLMSPQRTPAAPAEALAVPFFPLPPPTIPGDDNGVEVMISSGSGSEAVTIKRDAGITASPLIYLLDLRALPQHVRRLEFAWSSPADGLYHIAIASGDDPGGPMIPLTSATLYRLQYGESRIRGEGVDLRTPQRRLLRVTISGAPAGFHLDGITGYAAPVHPEPRLNQLQLPTSPDDNDGYLFTLPGSLPLVQLRIRPPQINTLARVTLFSRAGTDGPWTRRGGGDLYTLQVDGTELSSPPFPVSTSDRYWRLAVDARGGGLGAGAPQIEVGWRPQQLRFVARGEGPFLLAYGSGRPDRQQLQTVSAIPLADSGGKPLLAVQAQFGPEQSLGGEDALRPRLSPQRWKNIVLWSALIGSVLLLAAMAFCLQRRLGGSDAGNRKD